MPRSHDTRSRGWTFTINNWTDRDIVNLILLTDDLSVQYMIVGFEEGKNKTPHIQGYIYFSDARSFKAVQQTMFVFSAHIEAQKARKNVNAYCYCAEDGDYWEYGNRPHQGHRTDLAMIKNDIVFKKRPLTNIMLEYPNQFCQYFRPLQLMYDAHVKFDTKLITYELPESLACFKFINQTFDPHKYYYKIITEYYDPTSLYLEIATGKYQLIFLPGVELSDQLSSQIDANITKTRTGTVAIEILSDLNIDAVL